MQDLKELTVWNKSMDLVIEVYQIAGLLPREELFVLSDQMRGAAISIPSNISEGYGRNALKDYVRFLNIARGSKNELETQLFLCVRLNYISNVEIIKALALCEEIGKMLNSLIKKLMVFS